MKKTTKIFITIAIVFVLCCAYAAISIYKYKYARFVTQDCIIHIPSSSATYESLRDTLTNRNVIKDIRILDRLGKARDFDKHIKAGRYVLSEGMSVSNLINKISSGSQTAVKLTFNNIRTLPQLAGRISKQLECDSTSLIQFLTCDTTAVFYGFSPETFISMFIPNTYELWWTTSPNGFTDRMKREYDNFWNDNRMAKLTRTGLTREEVATLASIIDEETNAVEEMPTIAGVYINRLRKNMLLQACPTVKYALGDFTLRRILIKHTQYPSPYNTYINKGLPPGPIRVPSINAIDAVLNFEEHDYLFFCAKADFSGRHNFARTVSEHNRNAREYANELNKRNIK